MNEPIQLMEGLWREDVANGRITIFTLTADSREAIDRFFDEVFALQAIHTSPSLMLLDLSQNHRAAFNKHVRHRAAEGVYINPTVSGRRAIIPPHSLNLIPKGIQQFILLVLQRSRPNLVNRFFPDRASALEWLEEALK